MELGDRKGEGFNGLGGGVQPLLRRYGYIIFMVVLGVGRCLRGLYWEQRVGALQFLGRMGGLFCVSFTGESIFTDGMMGVDIHIHGIFCGTSMELIK